MLDAVRYHTIGSPDWDDVGRMLYLADFLEPGRDLADGADLARRVPRERDTVLREVARRRLYPDDLAVVAVGPAAELGPQFEGLGEIAAQE